MRTVDVNERRARLGRRHRLAPGHRAASIEEAADSVVALHATDQATIYLSAWARVDGLAIDDVDAALYETRTLVKHLCMRRTLFVFDRDLLGTIVSGVSSRVADTECRRLAKDVERGGLHDDGARWLDGAREATLRALDELEIATASELKAAVPELDGYLIYAPDKSYGGKQSVAPRVLTTLSASGEVVRGPNRGRWTISRPAYVRTMRWLGAEPERPDAEDAIDDLVARWLIAFGPGTLNDIKWWFGSTLTLIRGALARVGAVEVDLDGQVGYLHPDDVEPVAPTQPWAALLPGLDPTTMGWNERDWYLGPHKPEIFDSNGNAGPTAWWDGSIVGSWIQQPSGEVTVHLLDAVGGEARTALDAEAERLTRWLDGTTFRSSFPSPMMQRLLAQVAEAAATDSR